MCALNADNLKRSGTNDESNVGRQTVMEVADGVYDGIAE